MRKGQNHFWFGIGIGLGINWIRIGLTWPILGPILWKTLSSYFDKAFHLVLLTRSIPFGISRVLQLCNGFICRRVLQDSRKTKKIALRNSRWEVQVFHSFESVLISVNERVNCLITIQKV